MLTFAQALKDKGVPVPEIAKKITIKTGKNAGDIPLSPRCTAPSPTPNRTSTGNRRERPPSTASMTSVNA
ncbi:hypothetical protein T261_8426 [Streptomyces lydicus]|nr:hypothetical protein T261_8426 [Streptomyces lydicus]